jgi:major type 1 subunit fimbrin (pilin)
VKHIRTKILATSLLLAAMSPAAFASDGTITFTGLITGQTCSISGNGRPAGDFTVVLPNVSTSTLNTGGNTAGRAPFNIQLTGCTPNAGNVAVYFEPGANVDLATGRLKNSTVAVPAAGTNPGVKAAGNVQIGLLNSDMTNISVGAAFAAEPATCSPCKWRRNTAVLRPVCGNRHRHTRHYHQLGDVFHRVPVSQAI